MPTSTATAANRRLNSKQSPSKYKPPNDAATSVSEKANLTVSVDLVSVRRTGAPIHKLPNELLFDIFYRCVRDLDMDADDDCPLLGGKERVLTDRRSPPLNISHVCRSWRRVALSFSKLWSVILFHTTILTSSHTSALKLWLHRAQSARLTISISCRNDGSHRSDYGNFMHHLYSSQKCWRVIHLTVEAEDTQIYRVKEVPLLKELYIRETAGTSHSLILQGSPTLEKLRVHGDIVLDVSSLLKLKSLDVAFFTLHNRFIDDMQHMPSLECLKLLFLDLANPPLHPPISLSKLHTLDLHMFSNDSVLLEALDLPSLRSLSLTIHNSFSIIVWPALIEFMERCNPPLENLTLTVEDKFEVEVGGDGAGFLATLLRSTPKLKSLRLSSDFGTSERFIRAMTLQSATDLNICPMLEEVHFGRFTAAVTAHCLVLMIYSRWNTGEQALKRVKLHPYYLEAILRRKLMKKCVLRGLELSSTAAK